MDRIFVIFSSFLLFIKYTESFLDLDELQSIQYGIDIVGKPVVIGEQPPPGSVTLSTKYGQLYQCTYPNQAEENAKQKEEEKEAEEIGIIELLKPMEGGPCLVHTKGWWTYEFCYGQNIKQYHMEDGKPSGVVMYLGYYESEFDWTNSTEAEKKRKSRLNRYHSQSYVNGTKCDITGNPRKSEVRFQCEEGKGDYISNIDESESCVYIINVKTTKICHHPYLKPPVKKTPVPITCNPLLTSDQYDEYVAEKEAEELARDERRREKEKYYASQNSEPQGPFGSIDRNTGKPRKVTKRKKHSPKAESNLENERKAQFFKAHGLKLRNRKAKTLRQKTVETNSADEKRDDEKMVSSAVEALEKLFVESLSKDLQSVLTDANEKAFDNANKKGEKGEFEDTLDENDADSKDGTSQQSATTVEDENVATDVKKSDQEDQTSESDREAVEMFKKEYDEIAKTNAQKEHIAQYKENIESAVSAQFNDIVEEAQAEVGNEEGIEIDKNEAFAQLAKTLNKLMNKLDSTEKEIEEIDNKIEHVEKLRDELKKDVREDELDNEDKEDDDLLIYSTDDGKSTGSQQKLNLNTPDTVDTQTDKANIAEGDAEPETSSHPDGKVKVRLVKLSEKPKGAPTVETRSQPNQKHLDIPSDKKAQLESSVKDTLEKSGLETQGRKIEVKIITAGYYDDEDNTMHILSDTESREFNKMIVTILGGSNEAVRELEHQQEMENNYNFVWGKDKKENDQQSTGKQEKEEFDGL